VALDRHIVGQEDAKEGVLLGLLAREHVYMEGPPGIGKTHLAETAANAAGLSKFFYQFHRDTRIHELIGDATVVREATPQGEIIRQGVRPGGMLTADVCILDDISRAPGEALNVLLRMLNERRFGVELLKLRCAIATGNPPREEFFNEPLDPAVMDRFTVQLCLSGLLKGEDWEAAKRVVQRAFQQDPRAGDGPVAGLTVEQWGCYDQVLEAVLLPESLADALLEVMQALIQTFSLGRQHPALVTDRTFLVKAPRLMRARALLHGRDHCTYEDLYVLRFLTRFRLPEEAHRALDGIVASVIARRQRPPSEPRSGVPVAAGSPADAPSAEPKQGSNGEATSAAPASQRASESEAPDRKTSLLKSVLRAVSSCFLADQQTRPASLTADAAVLRIEGMEALLASLRGSLQQSRADISRRPGGLPRRWRKMRGLHDIDDTDWAAFSLWCSAPSPSLPHAVERQRRDRGGAVAVIRDVSDSMSEHLLANCASSAILSIVELARSSHMRVGYAEFGSTSWKHTSRDQHGVSRFFTRDYPAIRGLALNLKTRGCTHYQDAVRGVLLEFERLAVVGRGLGQRKHLVMISDGEPTMGCLDLHNERAWAQQLRVCVHTIFIGAGHYPPVLARLALDTGGKRFQAVPQYFHQSGTVRILDMSHAPVAKPPWWQL